MVTAHIDAASQKMAAEKVNLLAAVVESSDDAIITKKLDGTITSWNRGAEVLYGYSAADAVGRNIFLIVPPELRHELPDMLGRVKRGDRISHYETVRLRKDGRRIEVSITLSPILDESGRVIAASSIARDITRRRREQEILEKSERLLAIQNSLAHVFLTFPDEQMYGEALQVVLEVTESKYGVFGYIREDGVLVEPSMNRDFRATA